VLEKMERVDWAALGLADVQRWLKDLASPEQGLRREAFNSLLEHVEQGHIFEGYGSLRDILKNELQALVAAFLIELLGHESVENKEYELYLLDGFCFYFTRAEALEPYVTRLNHLRQVISSGISTYLSLLDHSSSKVREAAVTLSSRLNEHNQLFLGYTLPHAERETNARIKALLLWRTYEKLAVDKNLRDEFQAMFIELLNRLLKLQGDPIQPVAAVCLVSLEREKSPQQAIDSIVDALIALHDDSVYLGFDWDYDFYRFTHALTTLGLSKGIVALRAVTEAPDVSRTSRFHALNGLLHLAVGEGELVRIYIDGENYPGSIEVRAEFRKPEVHHLNEMQRGMIEMIVNNDRVWEVSTDLFTLYGLPASREELRQMLNEAVD
jgi:hypothetical protein